MRLTKFLWFPDGVEPRIERSEVNGLRVTTIDLAQGSFEQLVAWFHPS